TVELMLPVLRMPSAPDTPSTGTWTTPRPASTGMSLLQAWSGIWLPLAFTRLSLLKPLGPEAAWATGADMPTRAAVATASAKARFLRDMLVFPHKEFTDSARGGRVTVRVEAVTLHDCP